METRSYRYISVFVLMSFTFQEFLWKIMASDVDHHIVYQTFSLGEGETVECYGRCGKDEKINISRCDGQKTRLGCSRGEQLKIGEATLGKLSPDLDICAHRQNLDCFKVITKRVGTLCDGVQMCIVDVTNDPIRSKCGVVKYLTMDVRYACIPTPTTSILVTTTTTTTDASTKTTTTVKPTTSSTLETTKMTTETHITTKTIKIAPLLTSRAMSTPTISSPTTSKEGSTISGAVSVGKLHNNSESFWLMAAYSTIFDSQFVKHHKGQLALVFLLSTFVGVVIFMCIYLDYCRRAKKKRDLPDNYYEEKRGLKTFVQQPKERIELNAKIPGMVNMMVNHKFASNCNCNNNNSDEVEEEAGEEEEADVYANASVATPFFKRNLEHKISIPIPIDASQGRMSSPLSPVLSDDNNLHSPTGDILPPPVGFTGDDNCIHCVGSKSLIHDKVSCETVRVESARLHTQCEHAQLARHISFDDFSRNRPISNPMECHLSDNYVTTSKYLSAKKHTSSNEETSSHGRFVGESTRTCKCKPPTGRPRSNSVQGQAKRVTNKCTSKQNTKRARIRTMQKCDENVPSRSFNQKSICSDNETSRRKRRCQAEYKRGCRDQGTSLSDLHCSRCRKSSNASSNFNCCSSVTSNGQSSHEEDDFEDDRGPCALLSVSKEHFKKEEFRVEESGYQTRDTGTDSLCSSSFSTDQEDNRMFLPASLHNSAHPCKSKSCRMRSETVKRDQKLLGVGDLNKPKMSRRMRYTDPDVHQHTCTSLDVPSYDSSLDDASSKECMRNNQGIHKLGKHDCGSDVETRRDCGLDVGTRCSCVHVTPDVGTTVDDID